MNHTSSVCSDDTFTYILFDSVLMFTFPFHHRKVLP